MFCFANGAARAEPDLSTLFSGGYPGPAFCFLTLEELEKEALADSPVIRALADEVNNGSYTKYERHDAGDLIHISIPPLIEQHSGKKAICFYVTGNLLLGVYQESDFAPKLEAFLNARLRLKPSPIRLLLDLTEWYTAGDVQLLEDIEEDVTDLEDALISSTTADHKSSIQAIIAFRKKLLSLKRYYEQLADALFALAENDGGLLGKADVKYAKNIAGRVSRLHQTVISLRDYVTQVREAYQSQVDISLNQTMKAFTVITAIFLPLTLIAGWYGMNLDMPEYAWRYSYPVVIACSAAVVIACIAFFKKKKWF